MSLDELPDGWEWASIAELASLSRWSLGIGPFGSNLKVSDYADEGVPLVFVRDIRAERFGGPGTRFIRPAKAAELQAHAVRAGDLLITKMGDPPGDTTVYPDDRPPAVITADCIKLTPNPSRTTSAFLRYCLRSRVVRRQIEEQTLGVAQQKLSLARFRETLVPLPPLATQRRIVDNIDALLTEVNAARERLTRVREILKRFRQSVLAHACSGQLTKGWRGAAARPPDGSAVRDVDAAVLPSSWQLVPARDLLTDARYGTSAKCDREAANGVPVLRVPNIAAGKVDLSDLKFAPRNKEKDWSRLTLHAGDIIVCRTNGSLDLVGKAAVVPALAKACSFASYLIRMRPNATLVEPDYLHAVVSSPCGREQLTADARTTAGQYNLNLEILGNLRVPLPPSEEQRQIVRRVAGLLGLADAIEGRLATFGVAAETLSHAILAKALRAELLATV